MAFSLCCCRSVRIFAGGPTIRPLDQQSREKKCNAFTPNAEVCLAHKSVHTLRHRAQINEWNVNRVVMVQCGRMCCWFLSHGRLSCIRFALGMDTRRWTLDRENMLIAMHNSIFNFVAAFSPIMVALIRLDSTKWQFMQSQIYNHELID